MKNSEMNLLFNLLNEHDLKKKQVLGQGHSGPAGLNSVTGKTPRSTDGAARGRELCGALQRSLCGGSCEKLVNSTDAWVPTPGDGFSASGGRRASAVKQTSEVTLSRTHRLICAAQIRTELSVEGKHVITWPNPPPRFLPYKFTRSNLQDLQFRPRPSSPTTVDPQLQSEHADHAQHQATTASSAVVIGLSHLCVPAAFGLQESFHG